MGRAASDDVFLQLLLFSILRLIKDSLFNPDTEKTFPQRQMRLPTWATEQDLALQMNLLRMINSTSDQLKSSVARRRCRCEEIIWTPIEGDLTFAACGLVQTAYHRCRQTIQHSGHAAYFLNSSLNLKRNLTSKRKSRTAWVICYQLSTKGILLQRNG